VEYWTGGQRSSQQNIRPEEAECWTGRQQDIGQKELDIRQIDIRILHWTTEEKWRGKWQNIRQEDGKKLYRIRQNISKDGRLAS
jgi:hypothetical protein